MKRRIYFALAFLVYCLVITACHKDKSSVIDTPEETVTAVGTPVEQPVHKTIDASGGELASADGTIKLIIPAGALDAATDISIQPISNELPEGIGHAYRLTPHGQQFNKPVTLVFSYKAQDTTGSRPEFLDIAFQDAGATWQMLTNTTVNKAQRKISATTTHFSDWGYFKSIQLTPATATVEQGAFLEMKVTTTFPRIDPDDAPPGTYTIPVLKKPRKLRPDEIKGWNYAGEGSLDPEDDWAFYTAPDHEPGVNPEAVSVNINMHRKGQFMIVSNITVLGGNNVDYLQVDEDLDNPVNGGMCRLHLYGNFGNDPGAANRRVKINGTVVQVELWLSGFIRCKINETIFGPIEISVNNHVVARSVLRKFKGKFLYERFHGGLANAGSSNALKEMTEFTFVYRGFGKPCPANVVPIIDIDGSLAMGTEAKYTLTGSASVSTPPMNGCTNTTSVTLPTTTGWYFIEQHSIGGLTGFKSHVKDIEGGIEVELWYVLDDIVTGIRVHRTSTCGPGSDDPPRPIGVGLEGFGNNPIKLEFWGTDELKLKDTNVLTSVRMASGILIEAWDGTGNPSHYETDGLMRATFKDN